MNDTVIRMHFHAQVLHVHRQLPDTLIVDELGLQHGRCRADIALVTGKMLGFEIKGDTDSLKRLPVQVGAYSAIFDEAVVITTAKHQHGIMANVPKWWGVIICRTECHGRVSFETLRTSEKNPHIDAISVARLLWKSEAVAILRKLGEPTPTLRQPRARLYARLAAVLGLEQLQHHVRHCLRQRVNWRDRAPLFPCGD
jgi:hypothetical protein